MRALLNHAAPLLLACAACSGPAPAPAPQPPPPSAAKAEVVLPTQAFEAPKPWTPLRGGGAPVSPPPISELTWQVFVEQYEPHQKPTPEWQPLPAAETVEVKMPAGSRIRCIAPPLRISPEPNDFGSELEAWFLAREVLCSSDGFQTFSAHPYRMHLGVDGKREVDYRSDGLLRERAADGTIIHTAVSLRPEAPRREATQGPPQVLADTH